MWRPQFYGVNSGDVFVFSAKLLLYVLLVKACECDYVGWCVCNCRNPDRPVKVPKQARYSDQPVHSYRLRPMRLLQVCFTRIKSSPNISSSVHHLLVEFCSTAPMTDKELLSALIGWNGYRLVLMAR
jgi:hypothetical protein